MLRVPQVLVDVGRQQRTQHPRRPRKTLLGEQPAGHIVEGEQTADGVAAVIASKSQVALPGRAVADHQHFGDLQMTAVAQRRRAEGQVVGMEGFRGERPLPGLGTENTVHPAIVARCGEIAADVVLDTAHQRKRGIRQPAGLAFGLELDQRRGQHDLRVGIELGNTAPDEVGVPAVVPGSPHEIFGLRVAQKITEVLVFQVLGLADVLDTTILACQFETNILRGIRGVVIRYKDPEIAVGLGQQRFYGRPDGQGVPVGRDTDSQSHGRALIHTRQGINKSQPEQEKIQDLSSWVNIERHLEIIFFGILDSRTFSITRVCSK